jgi:ribosome-associated protein
LRVTRTLAIPLSEVEIRAVRSGGPGGQHANVTASRVDVSFDVRASSALGPRQRERLLAAHGERVTATASDTRSQHRNRELALERLAGRIAAALVVPRARRPTAPTPGSVERRLADKKRLAGRKGERRWRPGDDA